MFCGPKFGMLRSVLASATLLLADFDFSAPATVGIGGNGTYASAYATDEWLLQETSGAYANNVGSETLANTGGYQGQTATGLWDGASYVARNAWEATATAANDSNLVASGTTAGDSDSADLAVRFIMRGHAGPMLSSNYLVAKWDSGAGFYVSLSGGYMRVFIDDGTTSFSIPVNGADDDVDLFNGAWHEFAFFYDQSAQILYVKTSISGENSVSTAGLGSISGATAFCINSLVGASTTGQASWQCCYAGTSVGANAQNFYDETIVLPGADPTGLFTTQTRASLISVPVDATHVAHFAENTLPIGYNANFSDVNKLGLYCNSAVTNLLAVSEDFTDVAWVKTNMTVTANDVDSPDGFRSADRLTATAANGTVAQLFTTVAATEYALSLPLKEFTVGCTGRLIFYDETGAAELASQAFTADGTWGQYISVTATTNGGQISSSFRIEIDTNTEEINANFCQANLGDARGAYIRTSGSSAALSACLYRAAGNLVSRQVGEIATVFTTSMDDDFYLFYCTAGGLINNTVNNYVAGAGSLSARMYWANNVGGAEANHTHPNNLTVDAESTTRHLWDVTGIDSATYETVVYQDGVRSNGAAMPLEGTIDSGFTDGITLGTNGTGFHLDGYIQSVKSYDGPNAL